MLVHNKLKMRSLAAIESALSRSKQMKGGEYEQGRKIGKPLTIIEVPREDSIRCRLLSPFLRIHSARICRP